MLELSRIAVLTPSTTHCMRCILNSVTRAYCVSAWPRITVPPKSLERIEKKKAKEAARKDRIEKAHRRGKLIIACKRTEFNHYAGQKYTQFSYDYLASGGWKHGKSLGDFFSIYAHSSNPSLNLYGEAAHYTDFAKFGLHPDLVKGLSDHNITRPTNVQALAIPTFMTGKNIMCCAETGSGKTLAYLLPLLHKIMHYKSMYDSPAVNSPYAIILAPCRELADQIYAVAQDIGPYVNCKPHLVCGGRGTQKILNHRPENEMDLVVTTPGVLSKIFTNLVYNQSRLMHIVLDEADTLLDDSFSEITLRILQKLKITSEKLLSTEARHDAEMAGTQVVLVSATLPKDLHDILGDIVPVDTIERVTTLNIHTLMPHVTQRFFRVNGRTKIHQFLNVMKSSRDIPTIVFCKNADTVNYVGHILDETDNIANIVLHGDMPEKVREGRFNHMVSGHANLLVATDIASRGLDTNRVHQVINFDFPAHMSDYIHRAGRVGRVNSQSPGVVINFVQQPWEAELLMKLEASARNMMKLRGVDANIKRKIEYNVHRRREEAELGIQTESGMFV